MRANSAPPRQLADLFDRARLTPVQRRIAAHIIERGPQAAFSSSVELAEQVGVSQPSVTRMAAALGYSGFGELQREIQAIVLERRGAPRGPPPPPNHIKRPVDHAVGSLLELQRQLSDLSSVQRAADALAHSPVMPVHGSRSAAALAAEFAFFAAKLHPDVRLLSGSRTELADALVRAAEGGARAILAVSMPRHPRELVELLELARERGLEVVLLTDSPLAPPARYASVTLAAPVSSELVFDAAVAPLMLLAVLLEALADAIPERTRERLERFDAMADEREYFLR
jgi:DNA-binding MurR/RpiR family transcriptional regulator